MANSKIVAEKASVVEEIKEKFQNAKSVVLFDYRGLTVSESTELRKKLKEVGSDYKIYKNTLTKRAIDELKLDLDSALVGPNAISFGTDDLSAVKVISDFAKAHNALEMKIGIVDGKVANQDELKEYAEIPSREGLLTMLAGGMIATVKDLSICLNLYAEEKEEQ